MSSNKIRKHKGINQKTGKLKKGYKYSGKYLKNKLPQIIKIQSGGKVLGQGNYGCIVSPSYPCKKNKSQNPNKVSKLSDYDRTESLPDIYHELQNIKNFDKYFIFPTTVCSIPSHIINPNDQKDCTVIKFKKNSVPIINSIMQKGDHDLYEVTNIGVNTAARYLKQLLIAIDVLKQHNIAHFDLKSLNIIIKNHKPYIIDSDDIFNPTNWEEFSIFISNFAYMTETYIWPPEIYHYFTKFNRNIPPYLHIYMQNISWKNFIDKVMIYELGLAFKDILNDIVKSPHKKLFSQFIQLDMLHHNPKDRPNIQQCLKFIDKNFPKKSPKKSNK